MRKCHQRVFRKLLTIYIENVDQKIIFLWFCWNWIRLHFYIFDRLYTQAINSWTWVRGDVKSSCVLKLKVMKPQPKYKTKNFPNLRKILLGDFNWNQKQIRISKRYLARLQVPSTHLNSLFVFFPIQQWPCHNNTVGDKGLNILMDLLLNVYIFALR